MERKYDFEFIHSSYGSSRIFKFRIMYFHLQFLMFTNIESKTYILHAHTHTQINCSSVASLMFNLNFIPSISASEFGLFKQIEYIYIFFQY